MIETLQPIPDDVREEAAMQVDEQAPSVRPTEITPAIKEKTEKEKKIDLLTAGVAQQIVDYSLQIKPGDSVLLKIDPSGGNIAKAVVDYIEQKFNQGSADAAGRVRVRIQFVQADLDKIVQEGVSKNEFRAPGPDAPVAGDMVTDILEKQVDGLPADQLATEAERSRYLAQLDFIRAGTAADEERFLNAANKVLVVRNKYDFGRTFDIEKNAKRAFDVVSGALVGVRLKKDWCLVYEPNQQEADKAGMTLEDYKLMVLEACFRDWEKVDSDQRKIIEHLVEAKTATITKQAAAGRDPEWWSTSITMDIEGMKPASSVARRNMPGSEVYLAPNRGTLEGQYAMPYPVTLKGKILPDLSLRFKQGKVVEFFTSDASLMQHIADFLKIPGNDEVGEWGIGTNPSISFAVLNTLLNEKTFGIHLALGDSNKETHYLGEPVVIDNGNRSETGDHEDLALVMTAESGGGQIVLDGAKGKDVIFENGKFTVDGLEVINDRTQVGSPN
jgi:leucyl aminopeptidase (aminopeptidase T)